jgi:putative SOS response-associated peptidase YedK
LTCLEAHATNIVVTSHYHLNATSLEIANAFKADAGPDPWNGGALFPGTFAPVIVRAGRSGSRLIRPMHWGYPPPGASTEALGPEPPRWVAQVRNIESPYWIGNLRHVSLRCLIPATAFALRYDKTEHWHGVKDARLFAMAGIWRDLTDMPVFGVLATEPNSALIPVEGGKGPSSMPVILKSEDWDHWLNAEWKEAQSLVTPFPAAMTIALDRKSPQ